MANSVRVDLNGVAMNGLVMVTDYGYRVNVGLRQADQLGLYEGVEVTLGVNGEELGRYQVVATWPMPPTTWLNLRELKPGEKAREKQHKSHARMVRGLPYSGNFH